jgi:hypothetical protein
VPQMVENSEHSAETIAQQSLALVTKEGRCEATGPSFTG